MRTLIFGFLIFLCWVFVCRWYYVCKIRNQCGYETVVEQEEDVRAQTLNLMDNGKVILKGRDQFKFEPKSITPTLNSDNKDFIAEVAKYLADNPKKKLTITGNYLPSEVDPAASYGFFENLGLARADAIRQMLVKAGIPENRMKLDHNLLDEGATLDNPISFNCFGGGKVADGTNKGGTAEEEIPEEFDNSGQEFSFTNMSFSDANFDYDSDVFKPGPAFIAYADSVKTYLSNEKDKTLLLTGHTCDKGSDSYNKKLGKDRAVSVKKYFNRLGVKTKIGTASDGEDNPAYSNDTEKSRSKNRRVVVQIK